MTDNKRVTNKQILDKIDALKVGDEGLNALAIKIVSRMVKLKSMEDWFTHVSRSDIAWATAYKDLELTEEEEALGEAAKLMTLMNLFQEDEAYEKCNFVGKPNKLIAKYCSQLDESYYKLNTNEEG